MRKDIEGLIGADLVLSNIDYQHDISNPFHSVRFGVCDSKGGMDITPMPDENNTQLEFVPMEFDINQVRMLHSFLGMLIENQERYEKSTL